MKILNLYAGIGGNRKLWGDEHDITAVEVLLPLIWQFNDEYIPALNASLFTLHPVHPIIILLYPLFLNSESDEQNRPQKLPASCASFANPILEFLHPRIIQFLPSPLLSDVSIFELIDAPIIQLLVRDPTSDEASEPIIQLFVGFVIILDAPAAITLFEAEVILLLSPHKIPQFIDDVIFCVERVIV